MNQEKTPLWHLRSSNTIVQKDPNYRYKLTLINNKNQLKISSPVLTSVLKEVREENGKKSGICEINNLEQSLKNMELHNFLCSLLNAREKKLLPQAIDMYPKYCSICKKNLDDNTRNHELDSLVRDFADGMAKFHTFLGLLSPAILRNEIVCGYHNQIINSLSDEEIDIMPEDFLQYIADFQSFLSPLIQAIGRFENREENLEVFFHNFKGIFLRRLSRCIHLKDCLIPPPMQMIDEALTFYERASLFMTTYQADLYNLAWENELRICLKLFASDTLMDTYHSTSGFDTKIQTPENSSLTTLLNMMNIEWRTEPQKDFHKLLRQQVKLGIYQNHSINIDDFPLLVLIALEDALSGRALRAKKGESTRAKRVFIKRCAGCNSYFMPNQVNQIYCAACSHSSPQKKYRQNRGPAEKNRDRLRKALYRKTSSLSYCDDEKKKEIDALSNAWIEYEKDRETCLKSKQITEEIYCRSIQKKYDELFPTHKSKK